MSSVHGPFARKDGSRYYEVRWRDPGGAQRSHRIDRKTDADLYAADRARRRQLGHLYTSAAADLTLGAWTAERWAPEHAATLAMSTRALYARLYARHVEPILGPLKLRHISADTLRRWQTERAKTATTDQVVKARAVLSSILRHAYEAQAIDEHPLRRVPAPARGQRDETVPLSPAQVEAIVAACHDDIDQLLIRLLAYTGMRPGELRALRWTDVRERTILVQRATTPDGKVKTTKNRRARTVRLIPALAEFLEPHRGAQRTLVLAQNSNEPPWTDTQWATWRRSTWRPACSRAGLDTIPRPYDLRHSVASRLIAEGVPVTEVARQLGHSTEMTQRVYGHVIEEYADLPTDKRPSADAEIRAAMQ